MDIFSERLKELRTKKGITQKQAAKELKISATGYAGYKQGYREPDLNTLEKICKLFDVSADYLIGLEDNE